MNYYKYPRTPHLPSSPGATSDDKYIASFNGFAGQEIIITEKRDGECSTLYRDHYHARSIDSKNHESRNWLKAFWGSISYMIPGGWRVCGENLFARHSIAYDDLNSYFEGFSIWNAANVAQDWDLTNEWFINLGITPVPTLYRGPFNLKVIDDLVDSLNLEKQEGLVVRVAGEISYDEFETKVAKWVRHAHVQTDDHWMHKAVIPNRLK